MEFYRKNGPNVNLAISDPTTNVFCPLNNLFLESSSYSIEPVSSLVLLQRFAQKMIFHRFTTTIIKTMTFGLPPVHSIVRYPPLQSVISCDIGGSGTVLIFTRRAIVFAMWVWDTEIDVSCRCPINHLHHQRVINKKFELFFIFSNDPFGPPCLASVI